MSRRTCRWPKGWPNWLRCWGLAASAMPICTPLSEELQLALSRKGRWSLRAGKRTASTTADTAPEHNRDKHRLLTLDRPFLAELGVADAQHRLVPAMARKWKQINKFLEVIGAALAASPLATQQHIEVLDFGVGQGLPDLRAARPPAPCAGARCAGHRRGDPARHGGAVQRHRRAARPEGPALRAGRREQLCAARGGRDDRAACLRHSHRSRHPHGHPRWRVAHLLRAVLPQAAAPAAAAARTPCGRSCSTACTWARRPRC